MAIAMGQLDSVLTLGVAPVAAAAGVGAGLAPEYLSAAFEQYAAQLKGMTSVGSRLEPDLEQIIAARPDLILANKAAAESIYGRLSAIAPAVLTEGTGVNWKQDFLLIVVAMIVLRAMRQAIAP